MDAVLSLLVVFLGIGVVRRYYLDRKDDREGDR